MMRANTGQGKASRITSNPNSLSSKNNNKVVNENSSSGKQASRPSQMNLSKIELRVTSAKNRQSQKIIVTQVDLPELNSNSALRSDHTPNQKKRVQSAHRIQSAKSFGAMPRGIGIIGGGTNTHADTFSKQHQKQLNIPLPLKKPLISSNPSPDFVAKDNQNSSVENTLRLNQQEQNSNQKHSKSSSCQSVSSDSPTCEDIFHEEMGQNQAVFDHLNHVQTPAQQPIYESRQLFSHINQQVYPDVPQQQQSFIPVTSQNTFHQDRNEIQFSQKRLLSSGRRALISKKQGMPKKVHMTTDTTNFGPLHLENPTNNLIDIEGGNQSQFMFQNIIGSPLSSTNGLVNGGNMRENSSTFATTTTTLRPNPISRSRQNQMTVQAHIERSSGSATSGPIPKKMFLRHKNSQAYVAAFELTSPKALSKDKDESRNESPSALQLDQKGKMMIGNLGKNSSSNLLKQQNSPSAMQKAFQRQESKSGRKNEKSSKNLDISHHLQKSLKKPRMSNQLQVNQFMNVASSPISQRRAGGLKFTKSGGLELTESGQKPVNLLEIAKSGGDHFWHHTDTTNATRKQFNFFQAKSHRTPQTAKNGNFVNQFASSGQNRGDPTTVDNDLSIECGLDTKKITTQKVGFLKKTYSGYQNSTTRAATNRVQKRRPQNLKNQKRKPEEQEQFKVLTPLDDNDASQIDHSKLNDEFYNYLSTQGATTTPNTNHLRQQNQPYQNINSAALSFSQYVKTTQRNNQNHICPKDHLQIQPKQFMPLQISTQEDLSPLLPSTIQQPMMSQATYTLADDLSPGFPRHFSPLKMRDIKKGSQRSETPSCHSVLQAIANTEEQLHNMKHDENVDEAQQTFQSQANNSGTEKLYTLGLGASQGRKSLYRNKTMAEEENRTSKVESVENNLERGTPDQPINIVLDTNKDKCKLLEPPKLAINWNEMDKSSMAQNLIPKQLSTKNQQPCNNRKSAQSNYPKTPNNDDLTDPMSPVMQKEEDIQVEQEDQQVQQMSKMSKKEQILGNDFSTQAVFSELKNPQVPLLGDTKFLVTDDAEMTPTQIQEVVTSIINQQKERESQLSSAQNRVKVNLINPIKTEILVESDQEREDHNLVSPANQQTQKPERVEAEKIFQSQKQDSKRDKKQNAWLLKKPQLFQFPNSNELKSPNNMSNKNLHIHPQKQSQTPKRQVKSVSKVRQKLDASCQIVQNWPQHRQRVSIMYQGGKSSQLSNNMTREIRDVKELHDFQEHVADMDISLKKEAESPKKILIMHKRRRTGGLEKTTKMSDNLGSKTRLLKEGRNKVVNSRLKSQRRQTICQASSSPNKRLSIKSSTTAQKVINNTKECFSQRNSVMNEEILQIQGDKHRINNFQGKSQLPNKQNSIIQNEQKVQIISKNVENDDLGLLLKKSDIVQKQLVDNRNQTGSKKIQFGQKATMQDHQLATLQSLISKGSGATTKQRKMIQDYLSVRRKQIDNQEQSSQLVNNFESDHLKKSARLKSAGFSRKLVLSRSKIANIIPENHLLRESTNTVVNLLAKSPSENQQTTNQVQQIRLTTTNQITSEMISPTSILSPQYSSPFYPSSPLKPIGSQGSLLKMATADESTLKSKQQGGDNEKVQSMQGSFKQFYKFLENQTQIGFFNGMIQQHNGDSNRNNEDEYQDSVALLKQQGQEYNKNPTAQHLLGKSPSKKRVIKLAFKDQNLSPDSTHQVSVNENELSGLLKESKLVGNSSQIMKHKDKTRATSDFQEHHLLSDKVMINCEQMNQKDEKFIFEGGVKHSGRLRSQEEVKLVENHSNATILKQ